MAGSGLALKSLLTVQIWFRSVQFRKRYEREIMRKVLVYGIVAQPSRPLYNIESVSFTAALPESDLQAPGQHSP